MKIKQCLLFGLISISIFSATWSQSGCCVCFVIPTGGASAINACTPNVSDCATNCTTAYCNGVWGSTGNVLFGACDNTADCGTAGCAVLPVAIKNMALYAFEDYVELSWETAIERNNLGFEVQYSTDGKYWELLDFLEGKGNANYTNAYKYIHDMPKNGVNYYRLKQLDFDGYFEYSPIKTVFWESENRKDNIMILPNPATDWITLVLPKTLLNFEQIDVQFYDMLGQLVATKSHILGKEIRLDISDLPMATSYIIRIEEGKQIYFTRLQKI